VAVDDGECALAEIAALLVGQFVACLPRPFGGGENLDALNLLLFGGRLFHLDKAKMTGRHFSRRLWRASSESLLHRWRVSSQTASQFIFLDATAFFISKQDYIENGRLPSPPCPVSELHENVPIQTR